MTFASPGPRLFLSCPMDVAGSRVWFTDLWNYSIIPYMLEAIREGLQVGYKHTKACKTHTRTTHACGFTQAHTYISVTKIKKICTHALALFMALTVLS